MHRLHAKAGMRMQIWMWMMQKLSLIQRRKLSLTLMLYMPVTGLVVTIHMPIITSQKQFDQILKREMQILPHYSIQVMLPTALSKRAMQHLAPLLRWLQVLPLKLSKPNCQMAASRNVAEREPERCLWILRETNGRSVDTDSRIK